MKNTIKLLSLGLFLFGITTSRAQISYATGGAISSNVPNTNTNIGIGTSTPESKLHLNGSFSTIYSKGIFAIESPDVYSSLYFGINNISPYLPFLQSATRQNNNPYDLLINPRGGNVGIGTITPAALLDLQKSYGNDVGIKLSQPGISIWDIKNTATTGLFTIGAGGGSYFNIAHQTGKIGIGTTTPTEKLVVNGDGARIKIETSSNPTNYYAYLESKYDSNNPFNIVNQGSQIFGTKNIGIGSTPDTYVSSYYGIAFATQTTTTENTNVRMYVNQAGKVGIGTTNPDQKLTVKGKIHAEEIIVDLAVPADYVFQKYYTGKSELKSDYDMPTLAEIENFTKKNHHLPNVPSAHEIKQNGLSLGEMSNVLLQKVEELTLYVIEQNKKLTEQQKEIEMLKKAISH